jgi:hypothetical protein
MNVGSEAQLELRSENAERQEAVKCTYKPDVTVGIKRRYMQTVDVVQCNVENLGRS